MLLTSCKDRRVAILDTIFVLDGSCRMTYGGAERYLILLHKLLVDLGYEPHVWQPGEMTHEVEGIRVSGLPWGTVEYSGIPVLNRQFYEQTTGYDKAIYLAPNLAFPFLRPRSVVISHGIGWDYPTHPWITACGPFKEEWYRRLQFGLIAPDLLVSVDTNTLNWIRALWPGYEERTVYIPNCVDLDAYFPVERQREKVVVLYPRRLDLGRGLDDAKIAAQIITRRHDFVEFHFVGRAMEDADEAAMHRWVEEHPRCRYYWVPMHEMPAVYREADIVLIPTRVGEGTSLSCLEAMASGKAIVCGHVGGLTDLIIDGLNGRLINVTPETLTKAIEDLIFHPETRRILGQRALATAQAFSLTAWKRKWTQALRAAWGAPGS